MTLLHLDGFELYGTSETFMAEAGYVKNNSGSMAPSSSVKRTGDKSLRLSGGNPGAAWSLGASYGTLIVGVGYYFDNWVPDDSRCGIILFRDGTWATPQASLSIDNFGRLVFKRGGLTGGTVLARSVPQLFPNKWHYIECKVVFGNSGSVVVRVENREVINLSGVDTTNTANDSADIVGFYVDADAYAQNWDDLYICNGLGSVNNDFLGPGRVGTYLPDEDGTTSNWTPSPASPTTKWDKVDETSPDEDSTHLQANTAGNKQRLRFPSSPANVLAIKGVQACYRHKLDAAGSDTMRANVVSGSAQSNGQTITPSTAYDYRLEGVVELDPNTGSAWTKSAFDAVELELERL